SKSPPVSGKTHTMEKECNQRNEDKDGPGQIERFDSRRDAGPENMLDFEFPPSQPFLEREHPKTGDQKQNSHQKVGHPRPQRINRSVTVFSVFDFNGSSPVGVPLLGRSEIPVAVGWL